MKHDHIIIHCSYTKPDMDWDADDIRRIHVVENGWDDIGYHYVITRAGKVQKGRSDDTPGAHARGYNDNIGICLVGGMSPAGHADCNFTASQWLALEALVRRLKSEHPKAKIIGHRDVSDKTCPTFDAKAWAKGF